ncbi:MAG: cobaltochelatase subunit CobN [Neomegalonema sp.]|nr:cobaltochelatase subunit CobN [Neomegalonema sp.]
MHLLQAQPGEIADGTEPVDPGQTPADVIFISAADSELAMMAAARSALAAELGPSCLSLRVVKLDWLAHPFSVDHYLEQTALRSRLVIVRLLGGESYWPYGLEQFAARLNAAGVPFAALPGDDKPDEALFRASTLANPHWERLWGYLVEGGAVNAENLLRYGAHLLNETPEPPRPQPVLRAGLYGADDLAALRAAWRAGAPTAAIVFYRALAMSGGAEPIEALIAACRAEGLNPLPIFVASLKDPVSAATLARIFAEAPPDIVLNTTGFAVGGFDSSGARMATPLDAPGRPVLQATLASGTEESWRAASRGLSARDIAMNVSLPEVDGRVFTRTIGFKGEARRDDDVQAPIVVAKAEPGRAAFVAELARRWATLGRTQAADRRIALIFANYPTKDGRLANGVGLDAPASAICLMRAMEREGYDIGAAPRDSAALMDHLLAGPTNAADFAERRGGERLALAAYQSFYDTLPAAFRAVVEARWGEPAADRRVVDGAFVLGVSRFGNLALGLQPARGYDIDPEESLHSPDLPPTHGYIAFYAWLRAQFDAHALIHLGKHGSMEWLPGKAVGLSEACAPEAVFGPTPHLYPFIVNDPGEGAQAKRRAQAVILDHLTPPMTRAESHGAAAELEGLVDEFYEAATLDARRADALKQRILSLTETDGLAQDAGLEAAADEAEKLQRLDAYLCDLKEAQIRDGLHIFGQSPTGRLQTDLLAALVRTPRGATPRDQSLIRALAADLLGGVEQIGFDPLHCDFAARWTGPRPQMLSILSSDPWRSAGDTVERLELLAARLIGGEARPAADWTATRAVLAEIEERLQPSVAQSGPAEVAATLAALDGRFVQPGPSGAPTRGRPDVLPTGRNFFSVDSRALPTETAWRLGWKAASLLLDRHLQDEGDHLRAIAMTAWGTSNMRTGGDDLAQALALMGVRPRWDGASRRTVGFEILPLETLGRPRVDVTLRISGFFRDAFPTQVDLIDSAARAIQGLEEPDDQNPAAAAARREGERLRAQGVSAVDARRRAGSRVYGSKPGAYGAGLQALIDERAWSSRADLGDAYLEWGGYAYGGGDEGAADKDGLARRLAAVDAVLHNQDNCEHDILDSDDYYQFEGGIAAAVETVRGVAPKIYHGDHARPERPIIRTLDEEIGRVVRSRVINPKWIAGVKRHGYKGAFEIAATVDYLFAFAAATNAVGNHHFDLVYDAVLGDDDTRAFIEQANAPALAEIKARFAEAIERGLWRPKRNSARADLDREA